MNKKNIAKKFNIGNYISELWRFYESKQLNGLLEKTCQNNRFRDDLKQDLIIYLFDMDPNKLIDLMNRKELLYYCYGYLTNQYHSSSSEFFKTYRNYVTFDSDTDIIDNTSEEDERYLKVEKFLNTKVNWFDAFLFRSYYYNSWSDEKGKVIKGMSLRKIEEKYTLNKDMKIDHMFIWQSVKETTRLLKKELGL